MEYDIKIEMEFQHKDVAKILKNFKDIDGLEEILNETLKLYDSKPFIDFTKNYESYIDQYNEEFLASKLTFNDLKEKFFLLRNALILKKAKIKLLYVPSLWSDTILFEHFSSLDSFYIILMKMKTNGDKISEEKKYLFMEKLIRLLLDFDKDLPYTPVDENFFRNLKKIKWGKKAHKLFDKTYYIHSEVIRFILKGALSSLYRHNYTGNRFSLIFLAACNAINNDRDQIIDEDVILAFKTFYKLIHADVNQLLI